MSIKMYQKKFCYEIGLTHRPQVVSFLLFLDCGFKFHFGEDGYKNTKYSNFLRPHLGWMAPTPQIFFF